MIKTYLVTVFLFLLCFRGLSQIAGFTFTGASGTPNTYAPDAQPENGTLSDISRGNGINPASASGAFSANHWPQEGEGFDADSYFSFNIQANPGFLLSLASITFDERRTSTGIRNWSLRTSLDDFTEDIFTFSVPDNSNTRNQEISLAGAFSGLESSVILEFRIYGFNAEGSTGSWRLDNIQLFGSISLPDANPPMISSISAVSPSEAIVLFDEAIESTSGQSVDNYLLNSTLRPVAATLLTNMTEVLLAFPSEFEDGVINTLEVTSIEDLNENILADQSVDFIFILVTGAEAIDVVINEIMADPTPEVGLPDAEFVELLNVSLKNIDLKDYTLTGDVISDTEFLLRPGELVVLTDDSHAGMFSENVIEMSTMGALTNSGESIVLKDEINDLVIDQVTYERSWYKNTDRDDGGYSLERIGPITGCGESYSWTASENENGGTPGHINSVDGRPIAGPELNLEHYEVTSTNTLSIEFSTELIENRLNEATIEVSGLTLQSIQPNQGPTYELHFLEAFSEGVIYELEIDNLVNCDSSIVNDIRISFGEGAQPAYNELLITEIMANPKEDTSIPDAEYLELFNPTAKTISLSELSLSDATSQTSFPDALVDPGQHLILTSNSNKESLSPFGTTLGISNFPSLNNSGDLITISREENIIFSVNYTDEWYKDSRKAEGGFSLEMIDPNNPCGRVENWTASDSESGGTPGMTNSVWMSNPDNFGPIPVEAFASTNQLAITYNEKLHPNTLSTISVDIDPYIDLVNSRLDQPFNDKILFDTNEEFLPRISYSIAVKAITDCLGNIINEENSSISFNLPEAAAPSDIVLNEILFNPRTGGVDFVEILNRSPKHINLRDWSISNGQTVIDAALENMIIAPGEMKVFTEDPRILLLEYPSGDQNTFLELDLPGFPNEEGSVVLIDQDSLVIERFEYREDLHFTLLKDTKGVSLERVSGEAPTQDHNNWKSAASTAGFATPGLPNSQAKGSSVLSGVITVEPQVISPDNDGNNDYATINYAFGVGNYIATVSIYDALGRPVKKVLENATIPEEGFVAWDGTSDSFQKVRTGYYIILFEVFSANGESKAFKEKVAVGNGF